jgi:regulator of replication initiation timing
MTSLIVKILLALTAFLTVILQLPDKKSLCEKSESHKTFFKRLTKIGALRLLVAIATLALLILNETFSHFENEQIVQDAKQERQKLSEDSEKRESEQATKLEATQDLVAEIFGQNRFLTLQNEQLRSVLDKSEVVGTTAKIEFSQYSEGSRLIPDLVPRSKRPRKGDLIEWQINCPVKPAIELSKFTGSICESEGYGALIAFSQVITLDKLQGRKRLSGTLSNDDEMVYRSPGVLCEEILSSLKAGYCFADLTFWRTGANEILNKERLSEGRPNFELTPSARLACQNYERLTGNTCDEFLANQK